MALYRELTPRELAERIILRDTEHVPNSRGWRKRVPKTHPSKGGKFWDRDVAYVPRPWNLAAPIHQGFRKIKPQPRPANPIANFVERPKMVGGLYGTDQYYADSMRIEHQRAELARDFLAGHGAYTDGLKFKYRDDQLLAELKACENKLRATQGIMAKSRDAAKSKAPTPKQSESKGWKSLGRDETLAKGFEHSGFKTRLVEHGRTRDYQVLMTRR